MAGEFTDAEGLISPETWPFREGKLGLAWVEERGSETRRIADAMRANAQAVSSAWLGLSAPGLYQAPEAEALRSAMGPVLRDANFEAQVADTAADAMEEFTREVGSLEQKLRNAAADSTSFRASALRGVSVATEELPFVRMPGVGQLSDPTPGVVSVVETLEWWEHRPSVERNTDLIAQVSQITEQIREAHARLAKRLTLVDDVGGRGRVPLNLAQVDAMAPPVDGGVIPGGKKWFQGASDQDIAKWWAGLEPWEREAARHAVGEMNLDPAAMADRVEDAIGQAASRGDGYDDVQTLDAMLGLFGENEQVMEPALIAVGVAGLAAGIHGATRETGHGEGTAVRLEQKLRIVDTLRASLADVSADWDMATAREFADERGLDDARWFARPELGYLFADEYENPMGKNLTIAMADQLDYFERADLEHGAATFYSEPPLSPLRQLLTDQGLGAGSERINDPTSRVLGTLGQYPNAALEWLSVQAPDEIDISSIPGDPLTTGEARLDYFFSERVPGPNDGFEGVAALWRGALQADGGPQNPTSYDYQAMSDAERARMEQVWYDTAKVTTRAMRGLAENPGFSGDQVSERGATELGAAMTLALPHLIDTTIIEYTQRREDGGQDVLGGRSLPGVRGVYNLPNVPRDAFEDVYRVVSSSPTGSSLLADGAGQYQDELLAAARADGTPNPERLIERGVVMQGMVDGIEHGREVGQARVADEAAVQKVRDTIGLIPAPKIGGKVAADLGLTAADGLAYTIAQAAVEQSVGRAVGGGRTIGESQLLGSGILGHDLVEQYAPGLWTGHLEEARNKIGSESLDREQVLRTIIDQHDRDLGITPKLTDNWDQLSVEERASTRNEYAERVLGHYNYIYEKNSHVTDHAQDGK